jgi:hypothetical protein
VNNFIKFLKTLFTEEEVKEVVSKYSALNIIETTLIVLLIGSTIGGVIFKLFYEIRSAFFIKNKK